MHLSGQAVCFSLGGVPLVGNLKTGGVIGLTPEGARLCQALSRGRVVAEDVPASCAELVRHLASGGYLEGTPEGERPSVCSAYLHVTQRCNLSCRFCYSDSADRNVLADPTYAELCRAIGLVASLGVTKLVISGGEPFLRDDLPQIAAAARAAGIAEVVVLTNGLLVTRERVEELAGSVSCVAVAFDGTSAEAPAFLRGEQRFDRLVKAVEAVRQAGLEARIIPTLHAKNVADMGRYEDLAQGLGASLSYSLLTAPPKELGDYALAAEQLACLGKSSAAGGLLDEDFSRKASPLSARRSCGAGVRTLSVAADGMVFPCQMLHDRRLAMGNAFSDTAETIMGSEVAARMRALDVREVEGCAGCEVRFLCGGGCRARAFMTGEGLWDHDPYCELSRSYYACLGEQLSKRFLRKGGERHVV